MLQFLREHLVFHSKRRPTQSFSATTDDLVREVSDGTVERFRWDTLIKITIITTDGGPFEEDVFFLFEFTDGGIVVPHQDELNLGLIKVVEERFGDLRYEEMIGAMCSTDNATFVIWEAEKTS